MMDRISEMIEMFLVNLGLALNKMSNEEKKTVTLFLASLMVAAMASTRCGVGRGRCCAATSTDETSTIPSATPSSTR